MKAQDFLKALSELKVLQLKRILDFLSQELVKMLMVKGYVQKICKEKRKLPEKQEGSTTSAPSPQIPSTLRCNGGTTSRKTTAHSALPKER